MTLLIKINPRKPEIDKIRIISDIINEGGLVVFPTETIYGLGASAFNGEAIKKIFKAKGRPSDNPLIVHIANKKDINKLARGVPSIVYKLADEFWPGPLSIVLKKKEIVPDEATAGLKTVALRMPDNKIALEFIKKAGPIAAPSANLSGKPSGTSVKHIIEDFNGRVECIIDSGDSEIGVESTVISLASNPPMLLRPGKITLEQLRKFIPSIQVHDAVKGIKIKGKPVSPGMKYEHYAPKARVLIANSLAEILRFKNNNKGKKVKVINISDVNKLAKNLFKLFREADREGYELIIVKSVKDVGLGLAVMNRLRKAASKE
jgi:L-threonylcarbamoyladenylate synthase